MAQTTARLHGRHSEMPVAPYCGTSKESVQVLSAYKLDHAPLQESPSSESTRVTFDEHSNMWRLVCPVVAAGVRRAFVMGSSCRRVPGGLLQVCIHAMSSSE